MSLPALLGGDIAMGRNAISGASLARGLPPSIREAVASRDQHVCRGCGFRSRRHQEVLVFGEGGRELDLLATACIFCHQCFHLDRAAEMRSGALVWLPEIDQLELHEMAREIYLGRRRQGVAADRAQRVLDHILARRQQAHERLGVKDAKGDAEAVRALIALLRESDRQPDSELDGLRLMPLDRRILTAGTLEFNQFPQILGYWRSREGPYADGIPDSAIRRFLRTVLLEDEEEGDGGSAAPSRRSNTEARGTTALDSVPPARIRSGYSFTRMDGIRAELFAEMQPIHAAFPLDPDRTRVEMTRLPWYPDAVLMRWTDPGWPIPDLEIYHLLLRGSVYPLRGSARPLHDVNAAHPIQLDEENVLEYLRFFCFFVRGEGGAFHVVERLEEIELPTALDEGTTSAIADAVRPLAFTGRDHEGAFLCEATLLYSNAVYASRLRVARNGMVEMLEDDCVVADLPFRIRAPIALDESR